jgi:hypothetical protein
MRESPNDSTPAGGEGQCSRRETFHLIYGESPISSVAENPLLLTATKLPWWLLLYRFGMNHTENTTSNSSSTVDEGQCLVMACLFIKKLPRNGQCLSSHATICKNHLKLQIITQSDELKDTTNQARKFKLFKPKRSYKYLQ